MWMDIKRSLSLTFLLKRLFFLIEPPCEVVVYFQKLFSLETGDTTSLQVSKVCFYSNLMGETRETLLTFRCVCASFWSGSKQGGFCHERNDSS